MKITGVLIISKLLGPNDNQIMGSKLQVILVHLM